MSLSPLQIRLATRADLDRLVPLLEAFAIAERLEWNVERTREAFTRFVSTPDLGYVLVAGPAAGDGAFFGYAMVSFGFDFEFGGRDAFLTDVFVAEPFRRTGVAQALIAAVEVESRNQGVAAIHLLVFPENHNARALYEKIGFETVPRIMMTKLLPGN